MSLLEQRYRNVLRLLPASYRAQREDEMVTAFLESVGEVSDEDDPKPGFSEVASVAGLAIRVRLGDVDGPAGRIRWGDVFRLVAVLGLLYQAVNSLVSGIGSLRLFVGGGEAMSPHMFMEIVGPPGSVSRLAWVGWLLVDAAVIAGYLALLRGHRSTAKILALCLLARPAYQEVADHAVGSGGTMVGSDLLASLFAVVTVIALVLGFHRGARAVTHRRRWLGVLVASSVVLEVLVLLAGWVLNSAAAPGIAWISPSVVACLFLAAAGTGYVVWHLLAPGRRTPVWPLAFAVLITIRLGMLLGELQFMEHAQLVPTVSAGAAAALVAILLVALARHAANTQLPQPANPQY